MESMPVLTVVFEDGQWMLRNNVHRYIAIQSLGRTPSRLPWTHAPFPWITVSCGGHTAHAQVLGTEEIVQAEVGLDYVRPS